jgi:CheY-like chemotaxis protein
VSGWQQATKADGCGRPVRLDQRRKEFPNMNDRKQGSDRVEPAENGGAKTTSNSYRVLIVDGHANHRKALSLLLSRMGMETATAGDGERAVAMVISSMLQGRPFDVVVVETDVAKLDGCEAASQIRACGFAGLMIAHSAHGSEETETRCRRAGFNSYLEKPFGQTELIRIIQGHFCQRSLQAKQTTIDAVKYVIEDYGHYLIVRVREHVCSSDVGSEFRDDLVSLLRKKTQRAVIFDLTDMQSPCSQLLALFVLCHRLKMRVQLCNPGPQIREALKATKLESLFTISLAQ